MRLRGKLPSGRKTPRKFTRRSKPLSKRFLAAAFDALTKLNDKALRENSRDGHYDTERDHEIRAFRKLLCPPMEFLDEKYTQYYYNEKRMATGRKAPMTERVRPVVEPPAQVEDSPEVQKLRRKAEEIYPSLANRKETP